MVLAMNIGSFSVMTSSVHLAAGNTDSLKCVEVLYRCIELSNGVFMRRVTDGARTRDLPNATIRTHRFAVVHRGSGLRVNKPITRICRSLVFADVRLGC